jgi:hypothetical protein
MDLIVSFLDAYPFAGFSSEDFKAPLFVSAKIRGEKNGILIPDFRSIGQWWMSDIKSVKKASIPWEEKREFAIWRGGLTKAIRKDLCLLSLKYPEYLEARFSSRPLCEKACRELDEQGLMGDRISWEEYMRCKYLPYIDGVMCAAPALQWRLLSGSLTFKPDSEEIQWFYRALQPYVHYVPVKRDLSDLIEQIDWAKSHDREAKKIAENALEFAEDHILYGDVLRYVSLVLDRYGKCQKNLRKKIAEETPLDSRWVKIQFRQELKARAKKTGGIGFSKTGSPPG